jgi:hypothetical protein
MRGKMEDYLPTELWNVCASCLAYWSPTFGWGTIPDMAVTDDIPDHIVNMVHDVNEYETIDQECIEAVVESLEAAFAAQEAH